MKGRTVFGIMVGVWVSAWAVPSAEAHLRDYLVNQPYYTTKQGELEVAVWNDMNFAEADNDDSFNSKHQIEFEYGWFTR